MSLQHALWNNLLHYYKERGLLVEGPLTNLKPTIIQLPKPKRLINEQNPGSHFMKTASYNAKEVFASQQPHPHPLRVKRDQMSAIHMTPAAANTFSGMPVPMGMFMNMQHVPPRFFRQQQQQQHMMSEQGRKKKNAIEISLYHD